MFMHNWLSKFSWITPYWVLLYVACWPWRGMAEFALSMGSLIGLSLLITARFKQGTRLLTHEAWALTTILFLAYWLPELFSVIDSYDVRHSAIETFKDLRYLPFLWLVCMSCASERGRKILTVGLSAIIIFWVLDATVQALCGYNLRGYVQADRLTGIFGQGNLKLGPILASISPFLLVPAAQRFGFKAWCIAALLLGIVIMLAGSRAAWISFAIALIWSGLHYWHWKKTLAMLAVSVVMAIIAAFSFPDFSARLQRTFAIIDDSSGSLDHAVSGRLVIWGKAWQIFLDHPVNGVGVDQFQPVYRNYTGPGDQFVDYGRPGAFHAHQIILEILSETGLLGLLFWLMGAAIAIRAWMFASTAARTAAFPAAMALCITVFPFNTHLAFYSTFWGGLTLLLLAIYVGCLSADQANVTTRSPSN